MYQKAKQKTTRNRRPIIFHGKTTIVNSLFNITIKKISHVQFRPLVQIITRISLDFTSCMQLGEKEGKKVMSRGDVDINRVSRTGSLQRQLKFGCLREPRAGRLPIRRCRLSGGALEPTWGIRLPLSLVYS